MSKSFDCLEMTGENQGESIREEDQTTKGLTSANVQATAIAGKRVNDSSNG